MTWHQLILQSSGLQLIFANKEEGIQPLVSGNTCGRGMCDEPSLTFAWEASHHAFFFAVNFALFHDIPSTGDKGRG